jgi:hypothetical protein
VTWSNAERPRIIDAYLSDIYTTIAHELGHAPGRQLGKADHDEKGLMTAGALLHLPSVGLILGGALLLSLLRP